MQQANIINMNHDRSTALEWSVKITRGLKPVLRDPNLALSFYHGSKHTVVWSAWRFSNSSMDHHGKQLPNLNSPESARNVFFFVLFCFLNEGLFNLPRSEKQNEELFIFERGVFWSCPGRNSRVVKAEKLGAFARHIPVLSLYGSTLPHPPPTPASPGLEFCNFRLENEFRTNFNPILMLGEFVKIGNIIRFFTIF